MSREYDLVWQNLNLYKSSITFQYARYALNLKYASLPPEVIHQSKRCLLDTLCCVIGASHSPGLLICEDVIKDIGGVQEATIFGSGQRTTALNATLVNSFMVRFLDYNDSGGGGATIDVSGKLDLDLSGGSKVLYSGDPKLGDIDLSGGSTLKEK